MKPGKLFYICGGILLSLSLIAGIIMIRKIPCENHQLKTSDYFLPHQQEDVFYQELEDLSDYMVNPRDPAKVVSSLSSPGKPDHVLIKEFLSKNTAMYRSVLNLFESDDYLPKESNRRRRPDPWFDDPDGLGGFGAKYSGILLLLQTYEAAEKRDITTFRESLSTMGKLYDFHFQSPELIHLMINTALMLKQSYLFLEHIPPDMMVHIPDDIWPVRNQIVDGMHSALFYEYIVLGQVIDWREYGGGFESFPSWIIFESRCKTSKALKKDYQMRVSRFSAGLGNFLRAPDSGSEITWVDIVKGNAKAEHFSASFHGLYNKFFRIAGIAAVMVDLARLQVQLNLLGLEKNDQNMERISRQWGMTDPFWGSSYRFTKDGRVIIDIAPKDITYDLEDYILFP